MDLADIRLIRALGLKPFQGPARAPSDLRPQVLSRNVGMSRETVRKRLSRLKAGGVLRGFSLVPNLHLFGLATTTFHVLAPGTDKSAVIAAWRAGHHVTSVFDFVGPDLCIEVVHPRDAQPEASVAVMDADRHPPPRGTPPTPAWRLLRVLHHDAMMPVESAAAQVGCSARTARRLLRDMATHQWADVVATVDPSAIQGLVPGLFCITTAPEAIPGVIGTLGDHRLSSWTAPDGRVWVTVFGETHLALQELGAAVRSVPHVTAVHALVPGRVDTDPTWIDHRLSTTP